MLDAASSSGAFATVSGGNHAVAAHDLPILVGTRRLESILWFVRILASTHLGNDRRSINHRVTEDHRATPQSDRYLPALEFSSVAVCDSVVYLCDVLLRASVSPWLALVQHVQRKNGGVDPGVSEGTLQSSVIVAIDPE